MQVWLKLLRLIWAGPYSLLGLAVGGIGLLSGGRVRYCEGALEFYGGLTSWFVRQLPPGKRTVGFTLGHVILGQTASGLDGAREHERVHVRQFERWGPAMGPAYLLASAWVWAIGKDAYRDNPFEIEAYEESGPS